MKYITMAILGIAMNAAAQCGLAPSYESTFTVGADESFPSSITVYFGYNGGGHACCNTTYTVTTNVPWLTVGTPSPRSQCGTCMMGRGVFYDCTTTSARLNIDAATFPGDGATATIFINNGASYIDLYFERLQPRPESYISDYTPDIVATAGGSEATSTFVVSNRGDAQSAFVFTAELYEETFNVNVPDYKVARTMNPSPFNIPEAGQTEGPADLYYPLSVTMPEIPGRLESARIILQKLSHQNPDDLDIMLVAPGLDAGIMMMSDAGGIADLVAASPRFAWYRTTYSTSPVPDEGPISTNGTYRFTNHGPDGADDAMPLPAPQGELLDPEELANAHGPGTWDFYIHDDSENFYGELAAGITLDVWCDIDWQSRVTVESTGDPVTPTMPQTVTIRVNTVGLSVGTYKFTVYVMVSDVPDYPQKLDVTMYLNE